VVFDVYEKDISTINVGDVITFSTTSNPGKNYESKIVFIDPVLNGQTRTAKIRAEISNSSSNLKPEMFVRGKLIGNEVNSSEIVVPKSAVMWTGTRSVVYVQLENTEIPSFEYREVVLGVSIGNNYEIKSGLSAGEYVVTQGAFVIDASAQLYNQASMMNQFSSPDKGNASDDVPDYVSSTSKEFKKQLEIVLNSYYTIKESLVNSDIKQASIASNKLLSNLQKTDMALIKGAAHIYWMKKMNELTAQAKSIENNEEIAEQRKAFTQLSSTMIVVTKAFGIGGKSYEMYCPMANNKKGGFWLSNENNIRNPYYGDKMLGCGEIKNELKFN
jgi:Cu(I)/Ag(I) efflux system membrane fusion protein